MKQKIVDRENELNELHRLADSGTRSIALLYGRRRIGKTYLLTNCWNRERAFYFTASATDVNINRSVLIEEASRWSGHELNSDDYPTWRSVFRALIELKPDQDIVLILDEFQYLARDEDGLRELGSELNAIWEGYINRSGGLLLVLSGSAVRTIETMNAGGAPLHGRLDWSHRLQSFDYYDAGQMVSEYPLKERIYSYATFGGTPLYLRYIDTMSPIEDNIIRLILSPSGTVRLQLENILRQEESLRDYTKYQGILETVGAKRREIGSIAADLNTPLDTGLRRMVSRLVEMEFLEEERNFASSRNQPVRYRLADPALRFYYGQVLPNESAIDLSGPESVWNERIRRERFPTYVGQEVFEDVVKQAYIRFQHDRHLPVLESWGRWCGRSRSGRDIELDIVARLLDGRMMTGSVKFRSRSMGAGLLIEHIETLGLLADSGQRWAAEAMARNAVLLFVSAGGFDVSFYEAARGVDQEIITWTLEDLFGSLV